VWELKFGGFVGLQVHDQGLPIPCPIPWEERYQQRLGEIRPETDLKSSGTDQIPGLEVVTPTAVSKPR
jgi:hypothetical protein